MKNIVFKINSLDIGGIERLTIDTMNLLAGEEFNLFLILNNKNNFLEKQLSKKIKIYYLNDLKLSEYYEILKFSRKKNIFFKSCYEIFNIIWNKKVLRKINEILKENKIDVFIDYSGEYKRYIHKVKCKKKIIWQHASILGTSQKKLKKYEKRVSNYDLIVCVCEELKEEMIKIFPDLSKKIIKIYNFIDEERIKKLSNDCSAFSNHEQKMLNEEYFISLGRLSEGKGYLTTIKAFDKLMEKGYNEKLYIIGEGKYRNELEKEIIKRKLEKNIFLLGKKENPYVWLKNSKMFIHSSFKEGFGLVLVEALFCGAPVISSNYKCGAREILKNGEIGTLYKIKDYISLSNLLEKFINEGKKTKLDKRTIEKQISKFYKNNVIKNLKEILEK